jgi:hypothetical protein
MSGTTAEGVPTAVKIAALLYSLMAAWRLFTGALPAFLSGSPSAYSDFLDVALPLLVVWGLLTLRNWAWWLAVIGSFVGCVIPAILLGGFQDVIGSDVENPRLIVQFLTVVGIVSVITLVLLMSPSARSAFNHGSGG